MPQSYTQQGIVMASVSKVFLSAQISPQIMIVPPTVKVVLLVNLRMWVTPGASSVKVGSIDLHHMEEIALFVPVDVLLKTMQLMPHCTQSAIIVRVADILRTLVLTLGCTVTAQNIVCSAHRVGIKPQKVKIIA